MYHVYMKYYILQIYCKVKNVIFIFFIKKLRYIVVLKKIDENVFDILHLVCGKALKVNINRTNIKRKIEKK